MFFLIIFLIFLLLYSIFFLFGKSEIHEALSSSIFECGFTSYFFSRFSFSIQFFMVAMIFLFFDLELCCLMPIFQESEASKKTMMTISFFVFVLFLGLLKELKDKKLDWLN